MSEELYGKERIHHGPGKGSKRRPGNEEIYRENWEHIFRKKVCPQCNGEGWYIDADSWTGEPVQVPCEMCLTSGKI